MAHSGLHNVPAELIIAPPVSTPQYIVDEMLALGKVTGDDTVYDLGCRDARVIMTAAERYGARGVGVEIDPKAVAAGQAKIKEMGLESQCHVTEGDVLTFDFKGATFVYVYLLPKGLRQISTRLFASLEPGTRVVSYLFRLPGDEWAGALVKAHACASSKAMKEDKFKVNQLYLYEVPGPGGAGGGAGERGGGGAAPAKGPAGPGGGRARDILVRAASLAGAMVLGMVLAGRKKSREEE